MIPARAPNTVLDGQLFRKASILWLETYVVRVVPSVTSAGVLGLGVRLRVSLVK